MESGSTLSYYGLFLRNRTNSLSLGRLLSLCPLRERVSSWDTLCVPERTHFELCHNGVHIRFRADNENGARAKSGYGRDRFVHLPGDVLGLLDVYLTEVWIEANPATSHLWIVLNKHARDQYGQSRYGTALNLAAAESMFEHYSKKSGVALHPHILRHYMEWISSAYYPLPT
jgi:hypothetical protein